MNPEAPGIWKAAALVWCDTGLVLRKLPVLTFVALLIVLALELVLVYIPTAVWRSVPAILVFAAWLIAHPFLLTPYLIAVHRLIILGEATAIYRLVPTDKRFQRYFVWSLLPAAMIPTTSDLTWLFWTKRCERMSLERSLGHAEEEVQRGAGCDAASSD
jgi:hypothetical protein